MYTRRNLRWNIVFRFSWKPAVFFLLWSFLVTVAYLFLIKQGIYIGLPLGPVSSIGVAVAFYVGFKNNQSYDRYWEARKIWGGIVNVSRSFANQTLAYVSAAHSDESVDDQLVREIHQAVIYRHLAWINSLRFQLRRKTTFGFAAKGLSRRYMQPTDVESMREAIREFMPPKELVFVCDSANAATQVLRCQGEALRQIADEQSLLERFRLISMMDLVTEMYALQGKCERIKNTPFPRQYAYFSGVFTWIFITLMPFGLVDELGEHGPMIWLTIPLSIVIGWMFLTMELVGDASEDPFENFVTDVPMTALCRTIEIDLRQMLGEEDVPKPMVSIEDVLM